MEFKLMPRSITRRIRSSCRASTRDANAVFAALIAATGLVATTAHAEVIVRWDFADENLIADEANAANVNAVVTSTGSSSFVSCSSNCAASFNQLAEAGTSAVTFNVDTTNHIDVSVAFSTRTSGTASKYWKVQVDAGAGFTDLTPMIDEDANGGFLDHTYSLAAFDDAVVAVRVLATDSAGDGSGEFVQSDGEGTPSTAGTLRLDDILFEGIALLDDGGVPVEPEPPLDAGPVDAGGEPEPPIDGGPIDAGPIDAGVPPAPVLVVSEIFFNAASGSDIGKEWIEILNVSDQPVPLDGVTVESNKNITPAVERTHTFADTGINILPQGRLLIAQSNALGTGTCLDAAVVVVADSEFSFSQSAGTQRVRVYAPERGPVPAFDFALQYKGGDAPADTSDTNGASVTFDFDTGVTSFEADCAYASDAFGTPGLPPGACDAGAFTCPDGGAPSPEGNPGVEPEVEPEVLPPNVFPEIALENVALNGAAVAVRYTASDTEDGDEVEVALFYDVDDEGFDGVRFARGLAGGSGQTFSWDLQGAPAGTYRIFGRVTDSRGDSAYAYAGGSVQVGGEQGGVATLTVIEPDGVNDARADGNFLVSWEALLPPEATGSVSLYYDTDDEGFDGTPIAAGLPTAGEGATLLWETADIPEGNYAVYAVLDWTGGQVAAYGGFVAIGATGCGCAQVGAPIGDTPSTGSVIGAAGSSPHGPFSLVNLMSWMAIGILGLLILRRSNSARSRVSDSFRSDAEAATPGRAKRLSATHVASNGPDRQAG